MAPVENTLIKETISGTILITFLYLLCVVAKVVFFAEPDFIHRIFRIKISVRKKSVQTKQICTL